MRGLIAVVGAAGLSFVVALLSARIAPRLRFVDLPDERLKTHRAPIPPVGGIGVFVGLHAGLVIADEFDLGLFLATTILLVAGIVDDRHGLPPALRLSVEVGAGIVLGLAAELPGSPLARVLLGAILVTVAANAVNLVDGMDGLSGSTAAVTGIGLALLTLARGATGLTVGAVLAWALGGFLILNWRPARVFLGDGGAYVVGATLAYAMLASVPPDVAYSGSEGLPLLILASGMLGVIGLDLAITLARRRSAGRPLFTGDRSHVYDQLRDRGWPVTRIVGGAAGAQTAIVLGILFLDGRGAPWLAAGIAMVGFLLVMLAATAAGFLRIDATTDDGNLG